MGAETERDQGRTRSFPRHRTARHLSSEWASKMWCLGHQRARPQQIMEELEPEGKERRGPETRDRRRSKKISIYRRPTTPAKAHRRTTAMYVQQNPQVHGRLDCGEACRGRTGPMPSRPLATSKTHTAGHPGRLPREALVGGVALSVSAHRVVACNLFDRFGASHNGLSAGVVQLQVGGRGLVLHTLSRWTEGTTTPATVQGSESRETGGLAT
jgi:hypothetical protein